MAQCRQLDLRCGGERRVVEANDREIIRNRQPQLAGRLQQQHRQLVIVADERRRPLRRFQHGERRFVWHVMLLFRGVIRHCPFLQRKTVFVQRPDKPLQPVRSLKVVRLEETGNPAVPQLD
ncbi:hypothetical protein D3C71_1602720 [compost metagenome]